MSSGWKPPLKFGSARHDRNNHESPTPVVVRGIEELLWRLGPVAPSAHQLVQPCAFFIAVSNCKYENKPAGSLFELAIPISRMLRLITEIDPHKRKRLRKGSCMFKPTQYRAKAIEYGDLAETSTGSSQRRDFQKLEQRFAVLASNEQWLADNYQDTTRGAQQDRSNAIALADEEEHVLRCLGAALIMQWNTLPTNLQRELFDNAGSVGQLLETAALRGQIARFLHKHKNAENTAAAAAAIRTEPAHDDASLHAAAIARWDDEGGAAQLAEQRTTRKSQKYRRRARMSDAVVSMS